MDGEGDDTIVHSSQPHDETDNVDSADAEHTDAAPSGAPVAAASADGDVVMSSAAPTSALHVQTSQHRATFAPSLILYQLSPQQRNPAATSMHPKFAAIIARQLDIRQKEHTKRQAHETRLKAIERNNLLLLQGKSAPCDCSRDLVRTLVAPMPYKKHTRTRHPHEEQKDSSSSAAAAAVLPHLDAPVAAIAAPSSHLPRFDLPYLTIDAIQVYSLPTQQSQSWLIGVQMRNTSQHAIEQLELSIAHDAVPDTGSMAPTSNAASFPLPAISSFTQTVRLPPSESVCLSIRFDTTLFPSTLRHIPLRLQLTRFQSNTTRTPITLTLLQLPHWTEPGQLQLLLPASSPFASTSSSAVARPLLSVMDQTHRVDLLLNRNNIAASAVPSSDSTMTIETSNTLMQILLHHGFVQPDASPSTLLESSNRNVMLRWLQLSHEVEAKKLQRENNITDYLVHRGGALSDPVIARLTSDNSMTIYAASPQALLRLHHQLISPLAAISMELVMDSSSPAAQLSYRERLSVLQRNIDINLASLQQHSILQTNANAANDISSSSSSSLIPPSTNPLQVARSALECLHTHLRTEIEAAASIVAEKK